MTTEVSVLKTEQKMDLCRRVLDLIEQTYPAELYCGHEEVLVLAYLASTDTHQMRWLLGVVK